MNIEQMSIEEWTALTGSLSREEMTSMLNYLRGYAPEALQEAIKWVRSWGPA